ncbi:MAG: 30S ribosomal protein S16 [Candidatus Magasanikbacteria bacterium RIFCSPHIGHO2_01_FULL_33_34]|uniref:Small ribosomal subunit protein bS16 n=1 Tax=Candidatus Magasanikbacteria bacterium RIFCSPHIGHO2_01_FULL_33_34 TaxID=1798671 RepID=A0A1F6LJB3_9BACT|nr:MAG: 30S ribosomal protein S16 [Candidatus Magasanikbacteria bacterium RIFCSPHIGHO2_01_FULL_33_34]OGH65490.1 MAG: 30S ribosomal protein S16 [Candidatus Magasanikbacteria bacterium RIFCSPHIGHO2_02_FULL_33_17]OGH76200.1 MAG: 30S ribosomal protein S16 [Candidatus Magasanikbacteria bacterium RIFCSPLOWO2_01_FULL_33_34]
MLVLRLQRLGKKKNPSYRLMVSEKTKDTQAGTLEHLGTYNPVVTPKVVNLNVERIKYWISVGAQPSASVNNLLINEGIIKGDKEKSVFLSQKRKGKLETKKVADAEEKEKREAAAKEKAEAEKVAKAEAVAKAKEEAEAAKQAEAEKPEVVETPVEETKEVKE